MHFVAESTQLGTENIWDGRNSTEFDSPLVNLTPDLLACLDVGLHLDVMLCLREHLQGNGFDTK
jgi:hypothetical protein